MPGVGWNNRHTPDVQPSRDAVYGEFEFALDHVDDLFVRMGVLGEHGSRLDLPVHERHGLRMNETPIEAGKDFPSREVLELDEWHGLIAPRACSKSVVAF